MMQNEVLFVCIANRCPSKDKLVFSIQELKNHTGEYHHIVQMQNIIDDLCKPDHYIRKIIHQWNQQLLLQDVDDKIKDLQRMFDKILKGLSDGLKDIVLKNSSFIEELQKDFKILSDNNVHELIEIQHKIRCYYQTDDDFKSIVEKKSKNLQQVKNTLENILKDFKLKISKYSKLKWKNISIQQSKTLISIRPTKIFQSQVEFHRQLAQSEQQVFEFDQFSKGTFGIGQIQFAAICKWLNTPLTRLNLKLIFRGSRDGFIAKYFHQKCDKQGPTLTLIKSENNKVFGGFTTQNWSKFNNDESLDLQAFIFSLTHLTKHPIKEKDDAIFNSNDSLCVFGNGDIFISESCNINYDSYTYFPCSYLHHENKPKDETTKKYLAGEYKFRVVEIETYQVIQ